MDVAYALTGSSSSNDSNDNNISSNSSIMNTPFKPMAVPGSEIGDNSVIGSGETTCLFCGKRVPKNRITFIAQIVAIFAIIAFAGVNLTLGNTANSSLWVALLSSALGYILPSPALKYHRRKSTLGLGDSGSQPPKNGSGDQ